MPQTMHTKHYGDVTFVRSWAGGGKHIGLLANGGYAHFPSGLPVKNKSELMGVIPQGEQLEEALAFFEQRTNKKDEVQRRGLVMFEKEGEMHYTFKDGSITSMSDIIANVSMETPEFENVMKWWTREQVRKEEAERLRVMQSDQAAVMRAAKAAVGMTGKKPAARKR